MFCAQRVEVEPHAEYRGTILLVTHDEALGRRVTDRTWDIEDGVLFAGSAPASGSGKGRETR